MEEAPCYHHLRLRAPSRVRSSAADARGDLQFAGVEILDPACGVRGGNLPDGGDEPGAGGFDHGREVRVGRYPGRVGVDVGEEDMRVGTVGLIGFDVGDHCE